MATPTFIPVGGYVAMTGPITQAIQDQIITELNKLLALVPNTSEPTAQTTPPSGTAPLYDKWPSELADAMRVEIIALRTAIDATPVS
jgi:hypothetical protein